MNWFQFVTWAVSNSDQLDDLIEELQAIPAPGPGKFTAFVDAAHVPIHRIAMVADSFPADALKALPAAEEASRLATAEGTLGKLGDGKILELLKRAWELYQLWQKFKPV